MWPLFEAISTPSTPHGSFAAGEYRPRRWPVTCPKQFWGLALCYLGPLQTRCRRTIDVRFQDLFQWDRFITPTIIKTFYWLVIGLIVLFGLSGIFFGACRDGDRPFGEFHPAAVLDRRGRGRRGVLAHRRGIHPDRLPHQRASRRDPRSGADAVRTRECRVGKA